MDVLHAWLVADCAIAAWGTRLTINSSAIAVTIDTFFDIAILLLFAYRT